MEVWYTDAPRRCDDVISLFNYNVKSFKDVLSGIFASWDKLFFKRRKNVSIVEILPSLTHGAEPFLRSRHLCSYSETFQNFMDPEGSLPCSQEPYTAPYPELGQPNPYHPILSLYDPF
jgi:hypothetical protein